MSTFAARTEPRNAKFAEVFGDQDVEHARISSTPDAMTILDHRVSAMGLRAVSDGSLML